MKSTSVISLNAVANPVVMAIPYLYCLIAAIYFERASLPLVIVGGAFLGLGSAGFYMLWQRLLASFDSDRGNLDSSEERCTAPSCTSGSTVWRSPS